eukprot:Skav221553  [mRNA]  locus=scaffold1376:90100:92544:- [translate_table: standard]
MAGLVLDVVKCFNVLPRAILLAIMARLGFEPGILKTWSFQLSGLERTLYLESCVYGTSGSSTGVPEGDPLSVIAMFSMSLAFAFYADSRLRRLLRCPRVESWRRSFPILESNQDAIPEFTWAHGLWEEPPLLRAWQAHLDTFQLPEVVRVVNDEPVFLYSDGACLRPRCRHASLAAAAVILAQSDGNFQVTWHGRLPGSLQSPFRAELLAGGVAFTSHRALHLFSDCLAFVRCAKRLLLALQQRRRPVFPQRYLDLWAFFWVSLQGTDPSQCSVTWVPAHRDYRTQQGMERVHAWFNTCVDKVAREAIRSAVCPLFVDLASQVDLLRQAATHLATFQAGVAKLFANEDFNFSPRASTLSGRLERLAPLQVPPAFCPDLSAVPCPSFARGLAAWFCSLRTATARDPVSHVTWSDTSFLELFWSFVWSTGVLPPFRHDGVWVLPQDDPLLAFVQPSFCVLFRSWKRQPDLVGPLCVLPFLRQAT